MLSNPRVKRNSLALFTAAVAGPALVVAGLRYPGTWSAKAVLMLTGATLVVANTRALSADMKRLEG